MNHDDQRRFYNPPRRSRSRDFATSTRSHSPDFDESSTSRFKRLEARPLLLTGFNVFARRGVRWAARLEGCGHSVRWRLPYADSRARRGTSTPHQLEVHAGHDRLSSAGRLRYALTSRLTIPRGDSSLLRSRIYQNLLASFLSAWRGIQAGVTGSKVRHGTLQPVSSSTFSHRFEIPTTAKFRGSRQLVG